MRFTPKSVPPVVSQQVLLTQILNSLFANALEAMPKGGVLSIDVESTSPGQVSLMINDTGKGMTRQQQQLVFKPFFTTKPVGKGTGLGLSISYDIIVKKHGGHMDVRSTPGQGTCFRIWLPLEGPQAGS